MWLNWMGKYMLIVNMYIFDPLMYDSSKDQWFSPLELPYGNFNLVTVPDRKQLLAIGGSVNNNGVREFSNRVFLWDEENRK